MSIYSSREPFNDDPHPNVWSGHTERNQMRTDTDMFRKGAPSYLNYEGNYVVRPRPEYDRPQNNPTNPILVARRNNPGENIYYRDLERWPTEAEKDHARKVLTRLAALKEES